ncbi:MAG: transaldolase [Acidobacteria bacterium]|nr:transaldolase [Acidobacteriota bacterium]
MLHNLKDLAQAGVSVWLDDLNRSRIQGGSLRRMIEEGEIVGVTTNPTIFAKAIGGSSDYEKQLRDLALRGTAVGEALRLVTACDVRAACDLLRPIYEQSAGRDGRVSIEVDPRISDDAARTLAEARGLWWLVDRPNLFIKIPATLPSLPAITACLAEGISVNVTLIFSLDRYRKVIKAFLDGLEQRKANAGNMTGLESVASFFVSRVDTEVDRRLDEITRQPGNNGIKKEINQLHGQAAIANARLAYQVYEEMLASDQWHALAASGARPQRLLWASTGVKDKASNDARYVVELVAPDTVSTMPEATLLAVADHGHVRGNTMRGAYAEANKVFQDLRQLGIDMEDVAATLEVEGITSFTRSWEELIGSITIQLEKCGAEVLPGGTVKPVSSQQSASSGPAAAAPE